jgi:DNA-binding NarL/FixJ family response regulator
MKRLRILLVDDHPLFRHGLRCALDRCHDCEIVAEAGDGPAAIQSCDDCLPDVVLCDINLPGVSGLEVTRVLHKRHPRCAVIVLATTVDDQSLFQAVQAGAIAYLTKDISERDLCDSVRRAGEGEKAIDALVLSRPVVAARVLGALRQPGGIPSDHSPLTAREVEILGCIARGCSNKEIAHGLSISQQTVKNHVTNILRKLDVTDRTQAVIYCLRQQWITLSDHAGAPAVPAA